MMRTASNEQPRLSRREWLRLLSAGVVGYSMSGWLETLAADAAEQSRSASARASCCG